MGADVGRLEVLGMAKVGRWFIPVLIGLHRSRLMQDFILPDTAQQPLRCLEESCSHLQQLSG